MCIYEYLAGPVNCRSYVGRECGGRGDRYDSTCFRPTLSACDVVRGRGMLTPVESTHGVSTTTKLGPTHDVIDKIIYSVTVNYSIGHDRVVDRSPVCCRHSPGSLVLGWTTTGVSWSDSARRGSYCRRRRSKLASACGVTISPFGVQN